MVQHLGAGYLGGAPVDNSVDIPCDAESSSDQRVLLPPSVRRDVFRHCIDHFAKVMFRATTAELDADPNAEPTPLLSAVTPV